MPYQAMRDRVILKRVEKEAAANSPFITPEVAKTKASECEVVGVSDGYMSDFGVRFTSPVSVGDRVLIGKYSGNEHKVDGEDLLFVRWDELLAVESKANTDKPIPDAANYVSPVPSPDFKTTEERANAVIDRFDKRAKAEKDAIPEVVPATDAPPSPVEDDDIPF